MFVILSPDQIDSYWQQCREILLPAFGERMHAHCVDDYYDRLKTNEFQLWLAIKEGIVGAVVTSIDQGSSAKICSILSLAGKDFKDWVAEADEGLTEFAKDNACDALEYVGRRGFSILVPEYKEDGIVYVKRLK